MKHVEAQGAVRVDQPTDVWPARSRPERVKSWMSLAMVLASFLIYAVAALTVHREQRNDFMQERSSIGAAVSNVVYSARFGTVYSGVLDRLLDFATPLEQTLATMPQQPPGALRGSTADGNGIGYIAVATAGMRLFGLHTSSMVLAMLWLMGISALAFLWRFPDQRIVVVILYFTSLTIMLFTPLVWNSFYAHNISVGGIRYFSLLAILPAFHLLLECVDRRPLAYRRFGWPMLGLAAQVIVLLIAILVRNSAEMAVGAIATGCILTAWRRRGEAGAGKRILGKAACIALVGALFVGVLMLSASKTYLKDGRFTETVWHRIFVSIGLSPEWPFGNLRSIYDCTDKIPQGLVKGPEDRNGHCILWTYAKARHIPVDVVVTLTYGREYDAALREAFFNIFRLYPRQMLETFLLIKPRYIVWSIWTTADFQVDGAAPGMAVLLVLSLGNLLLFSLWPSPLARLGRHRELAAATTLFAAFTIPPYIAVWAMPHTSADLFLYCLFGLGLAAEAAIVGARALLTTASVARLRAPAS